MGNCISKINKDPFIVYEELMKNEILFSKGKIRSVLEIGRIYVKAHSVMKFFRNNAVGSVTNWGVVERHLCGTSSVRI